jgi:hypothetical protein
MALNRCVTRRRPLATARSSLAASAAVWPAARRARARAAPAVQAPPPRAPASPRWERAAREQLEVGGGHGVDARERMGRRRAVGDERAFDMEPEPPRARSPPAPGAPRWRRPRRSRSRADQRGQERGGPEPAMGGGDRRDPVGEGTSSSRPSPLPVTCRSTGRGPRRRRRASPRRRHGGRARRGRRRRCGRRPTDRAPGQHRVPRRTPHRRRKARTLTPCRDAVAGRFGAKGPVTGRRRGRPWSGGRPERSLMPATTPAAQLGAGRPGASLSR